MNGEYLEGLIQKYCYEHCKDEAILWEELNEIYAKTYGTNLECKKAEYCAEHSIDFLGMADFCEIKLAVGDMVSVFNGHIGKGTKMY